MTSVFAARYAVARMWRWHKPKLTGGLKRPPRKGAGMKARVIYMVEVYNVGKLVF